MKMMKIDAHQQNLGQLLVGATRYEVPVYQRNYAWRNEEVDAFLEDLKTALERDDYHFFGSIVILEGDGDAVYQVIDGQQRLTTFFLLLSAIRDLVESFPEPYVFAGGRQIDIGSLVKGLLFNDDQNFRLLANSKIRSIFETHVLENSSSPLRKHFTTGGAGLSSEEKRNTTELRKAFLRISNWLDSYAQVDKSSPDEVKASLHALILALRSRATVLRIAVDDEDEAFILFETLNDRGLKLTASDLLKSFTLRQVRAVGTNFSEEEALARWDEAVSALGDYSFTKFLRHYLLSTEKEKVQSNQIFARFKTRINQLGDGGAWTNLNNIRNAALDYSVLLGERPHIDSKFNEIVGRLNFISETHRILLLRAMQLRFKNEHLVRLASTIESFSFRWVVTGGNAQVVEDFYRDRAAELTSDDVKQLDEVIGKLVDRAPSDDLLLSALLEGSTSIDPNLQFYVLQKLNLGVTGSPLPLARKDLHIEHLAPVRPDDDSNWKQLIGTDPGGRSYDEIVQDWGNLTLLEKVINVTILNGQWSLKVKGRDDTKGLKDSAISITKSLATIGQWETSAIEKRTKWVVESIVRLTALPKPSKSVKDFG